LKYKLLNDTKYNPFTDIQEVIFKNRNISNMIEYMSPEESYLHSPFLLDNVEMGIGVLLSHIKNGHKIFIVVDSDVDGFTSASIIYNYLKIAFPKVDLEWMVHEEKSHGINLERIPEETKLIICPDSSSNEYEKHAYLKHQHGIDVLVIDHHDAEKYSENAVIINNQLSEKYPNKWLSGAGVVFKFCQALDSHLDVAYAENFIDLAAMGIIADMMDVRELENRYIITKGLKNIQNPFFKELISKQQYSLGTQALNAVGIMFYISPLINAVTRVGTLEERETMFLAFVEGDKMVISDKRGATEKDKETIAQKASRYATNCRNRQKKLVDEIKEEVELNLDDINTEKYPLLLVKLEEISNKNLTGLVANQLASKYKKPVLLLVDQGDDNFLGSGRNYGYSEITDLKDCLNKTKLFDFAEGHQSAFGAKISLDNIDTFLDQLQEVFPAIENLEDTYLVDFIFRAKDFDTTMIRDITKLRTLWGKGFDEPLITIVDLPVNSSNLTVMGQKSKHLKFEYQDITYVKFHVKQEEIDTFLEKDIMLNIVGRCDVNVWNTNFTYQVIIQDYEITKEESEFAF
jgi:single-stranded-DNA-specific exonuclease